MAEPTEPLPELNTVSQKAQDAMQAMSAVATHDHDIYYIKIAVSKLKEFLKQHRVLDPMFAEDEQGRMYKGVFLYHKNRRAGATEIWISDQGKIVEVYRKAVRPRILTEDDVVSELGILTFVSAINNALDETAKEKREVADENSRIRDQVDAAVGLGKRPS